MSDERKAGHSKLVYNKETRTIDTVGDNWKQRAEAAEAREQKLREALGQLVADYQDVPDPTDADGQAVFARARQALAETKEQSNG